MNTALVTAYDDTPEAISKKRTYDDHAAIWAEITNYLETEGVAKVKVERFDQADACQQCYEVTLIDMGA
jgi:hypothetical protein